MSYHSEHLSVMVGHGFIYEKSKVRGDVEVGELPESTPSNTENMRIRSRRLYGNTKFTDEQIVYAMREFNNDAPEVVKYLGISRCALDFRCKQLGLRQANTRIKITNVRFMQTFNDLRGNIILIAIHLDMSISGVKDKCRRLGITTRRADRERAARYRKRNR
jgi:hypothetical protein